MKLKHIKDKAEVFNQIKLGTYKHVILSGQYRYYIQHNNQGQAFVIKTFTSNDSIKMDTGIHKIYIGTHTLHVSNAENFVVTSTITLMPI